MSRATSIAGVRPLGWLARLRAQRSCLAWVRPAQLLGSGAALRGWGQSRRWAWERAMIMRSSSGARPRVVQTVTFACSLQAKARMRSLECKNARKVKKKRWKINYLTKCKSC